MHRLLPRLLLGLAILAIVHAPARAESPIERIVNLIPAEALAVAATPNLRAASDDFAISIEAMDRGHLLLGSKPLDHLKAMLGFSVGVNDLGGAAVVLMPPAADANRSASFDRDALAIVAVTSADDFLRGNFADVQPHAHAPNTFRGLHPRWGEVHVRLLERHIALSPRLDLLDALDPGAAAQSFARRRLGPHGLAAARRGDVFVFIDRSACAIHDLLPQLRRIIALMPAIPAMESNLLSIDFDPLGFFIRGRIVFPEGSEEGRLASAMSANRGAGGGAELRVPDEPFIAAGGVNASLITEDVAASWTGKGWVRSVLEALAPARSADLAMYPADGFLLNGAFAILRGGDGERLAASLRRLMDSQTDDGAAVVWRDDRFEMRLAPRSPEQAVLRNIAFGAGGPRGVIGYEGGAVFITSSERRATIEQARETARDPAAPLSRNPIVESMRTWMPRERDVEVYLDPAEITSRLQHSPIAPQLPAFLPDQPPIGFAMGFEKAAAHYTLIVPAGVLTPLLDSQVERLMGRALGVRRAPAP